jgi:hypothetical protein
MLKIRAESHVGLPLKCTLFLSDFNQNVNMPTLIKFPNIKLHENSCSSPRLHLPYCPSLSLSTRPVTSKSVEHSLSREAHSCSTDQEVLSLLLNSNIHYRVHSSPPLDPILRPLYPMNTVFLSSFNIILPSMPWSLSCRLSGYNFIRICLFLSACYLYRNRNPLDFIT